VAQALQEGNSLDRTFYLLIEGLAIWVLLSRSLPWSEIPGRYLAVTCLLSFAFLSIAWSDFPFIAFKRWIRDLGVYFCILIVWSERRPIEGVRVVLRLLAFLLVPLSIVLYKYYPDIGRQYDSWSGLATVTGATTSKNMLGLNCLVSGLFFVWDTLVRWPSRKEGTIRRGIRINFAFLAMTLWLMALAHSATSAACFVTGCAVLAVTYSSRLPRKRAAVAMWFIPIALSVYMLLTFGLGIDIAGLLAPVLGRDPTLTGRTEIWKTVWNLQTRPLIGAGYESFWLGSRLQQVWEAAGQVNQAHNGYLQVYLNLGLIGVVIILGFLIGTYRSVCRGYQLDSSAAAFGLALWTVLVIYDGTESAFLGGMLWVALLLVVGPLRAAIVAVHVEPSTPAWRTNIEPRLTPTIRRSQTAPLRAGQPSRAAAAARIRLQYRRVRPKTVGTPRTTEEN